MTKNKPLVSIVVPVYNAERFIVDTIKTVLDQTYSNWELILIDDKSTDRSIELIVPFLKKDRRIKLLKNNTNLHAALTRNKGIEAASGQYIAFLDADDLWARTKLEQQIAFMKKKDCAFSFTGYEFSNSDGVPNGKKVHVPNSITYKQALKNTTIYTGTVMFDLAKLSKDAISMPNVKSEDTACWWKVLKTIDCACGMPKVLSYYRRSNDTLSSNKLVAIRMTWNLYRNVENMGRLESSYYFYNYAVNAVMRRI